MKGQWSRNVWIFKHFGAKNTKTNFNCNQLPTLLDVTCCVCLHTVLHVVGCCRGLLRKVCNRSNSSANNSQHFFCFHDCRSVAQQCWICLHSSSNIVGATHAHYAWFTNLRMFHPEIGSGCKTLHGKHGQNYRNFRVTFATLKFRDFSKIFA